MIGFAWLAAAAVLLTAGAELFAENAAAAASRLGVTALAIGLLLAGAEPEELVTAVFAAVQRHPGIAAGDAIGANVTMLTLVLGLTVLIRPTGFGVRVRRYAVVAAIAGAAAALALLGGQLGRPVGVALVLLYLAVVALIWYWERQPPAFGEAAELLEDQTAEPDSDPLGAGSEGEIAGSPRPRGWHIPVLVLVLAGLVAMAVGGRLAVVGATQITQALGLRDSVVGLTFVALATTAELFALVWASFRRGVEELALAGVLGSVTYNATVTLGVAALVRPLAVPGFGPAAWLAAALPLALAIWTLAFGKLGRVAGMLLLAGYAGYLALIFR